ncbi:alpha/beta hydrolase [Amycolatopsis antarctica]|uniref:Alpha/beta hydrolase n=1 Tax=Amycolatopsis antarctica TaxID=1854586 RepID=A0A263D9J7_9PSEU|nr:alpha/beta hydrolase [Amycolatopsis antarctica]OZM74217.1 alpha/beta hydrolase [Amycolatopsis antarctica]
MPQVELSAGTIEYTDTGGDGPVLVLLHGLTMDGSLWDEVVAEFGGSFRCVRPTLPLGGHRIPMRPGADLTLRGIALLTGEFLERLDLHEVTLVLNDWGGAQILLAEQRAERVARLVLTSCEAFDNYPPGIPGKVIGIAARLPGGLALMLRTLRLRAVRRAPASWSWLMKGPMPHALMDRWFAPATDDPQIRGDLRRYALSIPSRQTLLEWAERMRTFTRPVLIAWATEDKIMPIEHAHRLAALFPDARLIEIADSYTLIPIDQPTRLAGILSRFVAETPIRTPGAAAYPCHPERPEQTDHGAPAHRRRG